MGRRFVIAAVLGIATVAAAIVAARDDDRRPAAPAAPATQAAAAPGDRAPAGEGHLIAKVRAGESVPVRARPGGRVIGRVRDRSEFGSRTALAVMATRSGGRWLGVATTIRAHGQLGWVRADEQRLAYAWTRRAVHVDLSERSLELREGDRVLRRTRVGVGRDGTPTPTGRFGVTDRMAGADFGWWYGCCILALSARQPELPPGWQGGDRVAIHGTPARASIGVPSTAGCLRADDRVLRRLMLEVPLGSPVFIQA
jgi:lipoprotein-anchoring transpeptidase ErfK/SrfK